MKSFYYIFSERNGLVLGKTANSLVAHGVMEGLLNTNMRVYKEFELPFPEENLYFAFDITTADFKLFNEELSEQDKLEHELCSIRLNALTEIDILLQKYSLRFSNIWTGAHFNSIDRALRLSDKEKDHYSSFIMHYASILEIEPRSAYNDLQMRIDSYTSVELKSLAYFEKFKKIINQSFNQEDLLTIIETCNYELFSKPSI